MLNFTLPTSLKIQWLSIFIVLLLNYNSAAGQCNLNISNTTNPSSCNASNGSFVISAFNGACPRKISVYKNNVIINQGYGNLSVTGQTSGNFDVVADPDCGCPSPSSQVVTLFSGTPTTLTPYVNTGSGSYQANKVYICRGSNVSLGVQALGLSSLSMTGPAGYSDNTPDGSSYWNLTNLQPSQSGVYTISYTNADGCISNVNFTVTVGSLSINAGSDKSACIGTTHTISPIVSGQSVCTPSCPATLDSLLVKWTLDQCNASNQTNQIDYSEFLPVYPSKGNCVAVTATNMYRKTGEHSCTPVLGSYTGDIGVCVPAMDSCDPLLYNPDQAVKVEVTITPQEAGRITKLSFREQSPLVWITTNGASGPNNYNTKYLLRVYKNNLLIYSEDNRLTERSWNLETIDFSANPAFAVTETSTFRFELRGYCVTNTGGNMSGWELDDIRVYGGCCKNLQSSNAVSYLWSTGETTSSISVTPSSSTNYMVTVTDCNGCKQTDDVNITVYPLPAAEISGNLSICAGGSTVLTASGGTGYVWSTGATTSSITLTPVTSINVAVTVTSANGCQKSKAVTVVVNPLPSPLISGDLDICFGQSTTLTASGGTSFEWSSGATTPSITVNPSANTIYRLMATDVNGCRDYTEAQVIVHPLPVVSITGDIEICFGENTSLTASGGSVYVWNTGSTTADINVSPVSNALYTVTVTDINGCSATKNIQVIVNPLPVVVIGGNSLFCTGTSSLLTASGASTYLWNTGATTTSIMVNPGLTSTYTVTATDTKGCTSSASRMLTVNALPQAMITGDKKICEGSSATLIASGGVLYNWESGQNTSSITVLPASTTIYRVTLTDVNGCTGTSAQAVIVNPKPTVSITGVSEFCMGNSTKLTANVSGTTFCEKDCKDEQLLIWNFNACDASDLPNQLNYGEFTPSLISTGGLLNITGTNASRILGDHSCTPDGNGGVGMCFGAMKSCDPNDYNPQNGLRFTVSVTPNEIGQLTKLTFREQAPLNWVTTNGATGINNYNEKYLIRVFKNGILVYSKNDLLTERTWNTESIDFTNNPEFRITSNATFTFELYGYCTIERGGTAGWEVDDLKIFGGECKSSPSVNNISYIWSNGATSSMIEVSPTATSTYSVTVTDCNGCLASDSKAVTVNPLPTPAITGNTVICNGASTTLTASGGTTYVWSNGSTTSVITVSPASTTTYNVTVTDANGCQASTSVTVTVNPLPTPAITGNTVICNGASTTLTASGGTTYIWSNGATTSAITVSPASTTTYNVTVSDANGCQASTSVTVTVNPLPTPAITGNTVICNGASTTLTASGGTTYVWSNGATTSAITVSPTSTTTYNVTVTDANGCQASTSVTVTVNPLPTPAITGNIVICNGASTTLTASGGTTYVWSNGATTSVITVSPASTTTYYVTVTDANGCQASTSVTVTVNPLPTPSITGNTVICNGASTTLTASGGTTYVWSNGSTTSAITISPTSTTTYNVTVSDANGCQASTSVTVTVNPLPTPSITGNTVICNGASTTLTASGGTTYVWSNGSTTSVITVSPTSTTTYNVTVTDANGCQASTSVTVTVNPLPTPAITGNTVICNGASTTLTASGGTTYVWSNGATTSAITVSPTSTTTYNVTVSDANGCQASTSVTVTVNPLPTPAITGNTVICNGESTTLTASGGTTYVWSNGATTSVITVSPSSTTTYNVTVSDANGCQASTSVTVTVNPLPTPAITGNTVICNGASTTLTASGGTTYVWSNGATTSAITVSPTSTTTYNVTVSDANGCQASTSVTVTVNPLPTPAITGNTVICNGESTTLTASGGTTYVWSNGATTSVITVSPASTTTYNVTVTDANGCQASTSVIVTVNPLPTPAITGNTVICNGESTTLTASGGTTYVWSNGSTTSVITVSPASTTTYNVTVTDANGCQASTSVAVTVNPLPTPAITGNTVICNGEITTLTASGGTTYVWSNGSTTSAITVSPASTTTYNVTVTDANGCQASTSVTVTVNPLPTPAITGNTVICNGESTTLTASGGTTYVWSNGSTTSVITVSPASTTTYNVTVTDANGCQASTSVAVTVNPLPTPSITGNTVICNGEITTLTASGGTTYVWSNGATTSVITVSPASTTTYNVTVTDANGCQASTSVTVTVNPLPTPAITGNIVICNGASTTLTASGGTTYVWSNGATTSAITISPTSTTTYNVTVTDANGCQASASVTVTVNPLPTPAITGNTVICNGESTTLTASGGTTYVWSNGATTSAITVSPASSTTYDVTVTDANGCQASTSVTVAVNPLPTPAITGNTVICNGASTTLTASGGTTYVWSNGATTSAITVSPASTTTYNVTVTDANGCQASTSVTVTVNPLPTPAITGNTVICNGASTTLTASGGTTYVWSNGATTSAITVSPASTTTYNVTVTDANGCQASTSVTVTVNPLPTPAITGNTVICNGESTTLTASGGTTYVWSNGATTSAITVSPTSTITYNVTVTDANGCQASTSLTVTVNPLPVVSISGETEICVNDCTTLTASGGATYEWLGLQSNGYECNGAFFVGGSQGGAIQSLYNVNSSNALNFIGSLGTNNVNGIGYYCEGGNRPHIYGMKSFGNSQSDAVRANLVKIDPKSGALTVLGEIPQAPNLYGATGTTGIMTYIGDISEDGIYYFPAVTALINPITFEIIDYTIYLGSIDLKNHGNGANVNYQPISILTTCKPYMDACILAFQQYALNPSVGEPSGGIQDWALSADGQTLYSYFGIENALFRLNLGTNSTSCVPGPVSNGLFTGMTGAMTDEFGGIYFKDGILYGHQVDRGRIFSIDQLTGALTLVTEGLPLDFRGDNAKCGNCGTTSTGGNQSASALVEVCPTSTTTYTVKVTDTNGCMTTASVTVVVNPLPTPTINGDTEICVGESTTLTAGGGISFLWSNGATSPSITVNPIVNTSYSVTVKDTKGCEASTSVAIRVNPLPVPTILGNTTICLGQQTLLGALGGISYIWSTGATTTVINVNPAATTTYILTATDAKGCQASTSVTVTVNPLPTPAIAGNTVICNGGSTTLTASGGTTYVWSNGSTTSAITVSPTSTTTYNVTVSDANGCQASTSVKVAVNPLPTPAITGNTVICNGGSTTLTASGGTTYVWSNGATTSAITVSPTSTTTYNVTVTDANGCQASTSVIVTVNPLPTPAITGNTVICNGASTTLTAIGGTTYVWSNGATTSAITVSPTSTTTYNVTVTDANGCQASTSVIVTVYPLPTPAITGNTVICNGGSTTLTASGGTTYVWSNGATTSAITVSPTSTTTYNVAVTDANGCQASTSVTVAVNPLPTPAITGNNVICNGGSTTLTASGGTTYVWSNGATTSAITVSPTSTTTYNVTVTDANGCQASTSVTVTVNPLPTPAITGNIVVCNGASTTLTASGGTTYVWSNGATTSVITVSPSSTTTYNVTVSDANGCQASTSVTVTVNPLPTPAITGNTVICTGSSTRLYASGGVTYLWSTGATSYWIDVTPNISTTYNVTVTDANGCQASASVTVTVNPLPTPAITGNTVICNGGSTTLTASGGTTYVWSNGATTSAITVSPTSTTTYNVTVTDGNGCQASTSVTVTVNPLPTPAITGNTVICTGSSTRLYASGGVTYLWSTGATSYWIDVTPNISTTYNVTVTDANGCQASASVTVTVNPLPTPAIAGNTVICNGGSTTLTASGGTTYTWSNGATTSAITVSPASTTTYNVIVSDANGCQASASVTVTVNPLPTPTITGNTVICNGGSTTVTASGGTTYVWSNGATTSAITVSPTSTITYNVTVTDANDCQASTSVTVTVNPLPTPAISGNTVICSGASTTLTASGGTTYVWSNGASTSAITVSPTSTTTYNVTVTDANGCQASTSVTVTVNPLPTPAITGNTVICSGASTTLTASGGTTYVWSNGASTSAITVSPTSTTTYNVTVSDANGCQASASVTVTVNPLSTPAIAGNTVICNGGSTTLTASGGTTYVWSNGATTSAITVSPTSTTTYNVTVTDANGCQASASVTVTVNPLPTPAITGNTVICSGASTTLTASGGTTYVWSNGASTSAITVSPTSTTTYNVTVTDANGCQASTSETVTVNPLPTPAITGNTVICSGASTTLSASGGTTYVWSNGASTSAITVSPTSTTTYILTVSDANGCQASTSVIVTVNPLPTPAIAGNTVICSGASTTLIASGGSTYVWSNGATTSAITVSPTSTTTYNVTVTDANGCQASTSVTVSVLTLPSTIITGNIEVCIGGSTKLTASGGNTYLWNTGATTSMITVSPIVQTQYSVTVSDSNGCSSNSSVTVEVVPLPQASITGNLIICHGGSTSLTASGGTGYLWSNGATTAGIDVSPLINTTYTVTVTNSKGCTATKSVLITVNPLPLVSITGNNTVCQDAFTKLTATGGGTYLWSNGETTSMISVNPSSAMSYIVTVTTAAGCSATASINVTVKPKPTINLVGIDKICKGDSSVIVATGYSNNPCPGVCNVTNPILLAHWNLNACASVMSQGTHMDYSEFKPIVNSSNCTSVTAGNVHRLGTNKHSCTPGPNGSIGMCIGSQKTCNPGKADFSQALRFEVTINPNQSSHLTGLQFYEQAPEMYSWVNGPTGQNNYATKFLLRVSKNGEFIYYEDSISTHRTWGLVDFDFSSNPNFQSNVTSKYLFELVPYCTVNNGAVESVWDIDEIKVFGGCCAGTSHEISSYLWSNGDTGTSITVKPTVTTNYTVTVTDCCGCSSEENYLVTVNCLMADLGPDKMINLGQTVTLTPVITGNTICNENDRDQNGVKYLWSNGATTSSITVTPSTSTFFRVTVTDCNDCQDTESISIHVMMGKPIITYPNPASDRINIASESDIDAGISVKFYTVDGKKVLVDNPEIIFNNYRNVSVIIPNQLSDGIYFLEIRNGDKVYTEKNNTAAEVIAFVSNVL